MKWVICYLVPIQETFVLQVWKKTGVVDMLGHPWSYHIGPGHLCQLAHVLSSQLAERSEPEFFSVGHSG